MSEPAPVVPSVPASQQRQRPAPPIDTRPQLAEILTVLQDIAAKLDSIADEFREDDPPLHAQFGQVKVASTGTAVVLGFATVTAVVVQALKGNAGVVTIGTEGVGQTAGFELQAGQAVGVNVEGLYQLSVNGASGDGVCWIGS